MSEQRTPAFRNAMSGFNKKDVTEYIAKMSRSFEEIKAEHEEEVNKLKEELAAAKAELEVLKGTEMTVPEAEAEVPEIKENREIAPAVELARANAVIAAQTERIDAIAREKAELEAQITELKVKLDEYAESDAKLEQYDSMANRMGEIFMGATAEAERIRSDAKAYADTLIHDTETKCNNYRVSLEKKLSEFAAVRRNEITKLFDNTQKEINALLTSFGEKSQSMANEKLCVEIELPHTIDSLPDNK